MIGKATLPLTAAVLLAGSIQFATAETILITPEQEIVVREYIVEHPVEAPIDVPPGYRMVVGEPIPDGYEPGALVLEQPLEREYQYVNIDGRTALIDPETRRVVYIFD